MTYEQNETSISSGQPIELYKFSGTYNSYRMTSFVRDVLSGGLVYESIPINRDNLKSGTQEDDNIILEVTLPFDHPMAVEYAYNNAPPKLDFELIRAHSQNVEDTIIAFKGKVQSFSVEGRTTKLRIPSVFSYILNSNVPVPRYQAPCNHTLYDERCGVNKAANQHNTTVSSVSGNNIVLASLPFGNGDTVTGIIDNLQGESRMITSQVGAQLTISYPFSKLTPGMQVQISRGCNRSLSTCRNKFGNQARFGGFPLVPSVNPFTTNLKSG